MLQKGEVVEKGDGVISVVFERADACKHCSGCSMQDKCTKVELKGDADVGDTVDVEMPDRNVVGASLLAYIAPLAVLLGGMALGVLLHDALGVGMDKNLFGALCGLALMAVSFFFIHRIDLRLRNRRNWLPRVVAVHKKQPEGGFYGG